MDYIVREALNKNRRVDEVYDFFVIGEAEDENGNTVRIKKRVGSYRLTELLEEKERLEAELNEINAKISAIQKAQRGAEIKEKEE